MIAMKPEKILANAIAFAAEKHKDQVDKGGKPYILHVLKVSYLLKTDDLELMAAAVLHDCIEDCGVTTSELYELGMSARVVETVVGLTKVNGETHEEKVNRLTKTKDIIRCKLADLRHNMDPRRLKKITPKTEARMLEYMLLTEILSNALAK